MEAVLISIQPKWCELIASGKKTVEVRKTKPKIGVPFKCYIYCTKGDWLTSVNGKVQKPNSIKIDLTTDSKIEELNGTVIGEFVCDNINSIEHTNGTIIEQGRCDTAYTLEGSCIVLFDDIVNYMGKQEKAYGWHISDLVIYDKPKELSEFNHCGVNYHFNPPITRPPQSWCYVEERSRR